MNKNRSRRVGPMKYNSKQKPQVISAKPGTNESTFDREQRLEHERVARHSIGGINVKSWMSWCPTPIPDHSRRGSRNAGLGVTGCMVRIAATNKIWTVWI